jgi:hypothetical protein
VAERYENVAAKRRDQRVGGRVFWSIDISHSTKRRRNSVVSPPSRRVPRTPPAPQSRDETRQVGLPNFVPASHPRWPSLKPNSGIQYPLTKHSLGGPLEDTEQARASISWVGKVLFDADHVCDRHVACQKWMSALGLGTNRLGNLLVPSLVFQLRRSNTADTSAGTDRLDMHGFRRETVAQHPNLLLQPCLLPYSYLRPHLPLTVSPSPIGQYRVCRRSGLVSMLPAASRRTDGQYRTSLRARRGVLPTVVHKGGRECRKS